MGGSESPRRSRHSVAQTDPLYWARARAAESDPFGRPIDPEAATEEFPSVAPEWSGRLPLPAPADLPPRRPWSGEDATTDSLPAVREDDFRRVLARPREDATTVDLPAIPSSEVETVDYRDHPLALVPRPYGSGRSSIARRNYVGRHRPAPAPAPTRLGLSTAGMTLAVGVLGVTLAMLHAQPGDQTDRSAPPLAAVSPTGTPEAANPGGDATEPIPTPGPDGQLIPRPGTTPSAAPATPGTSRRAAPAVAPGAPGAHDDGSDPDGDDGETAEEAPATPRSGGRPTRTRQPDSVARPSTTTPRCATSIDRASVRTSAFASGAADATATTTATAQADPDDETDSESPEPDEETPEPPSPSATRC